MTIAARPTRQRRAVLAALAGEEGFRTAQDIHALLRERGEDVGLTTVYRTLQALDVGLRVSAIVRDDLGARAIEAHRVAERHVDI